MSALTSWISVPLADLVQDRQIPYGIVQPGHHIEAGVPVVRVKDLQAGIIDTRSPLRVDPAISQKHDRTTLRGGELLLSLVGTVGEAAIAPADVRDWNVARAIAVIRPETVTAQWLKFCFASPVIRHELRRVLNTTVQATLNLADLKRIKIPVPPKSVMDAIGEMLGALDDKIAANAALVRMSDELAGACTRSSMEPMETVALSELALITMGSSPPGTSYNEDGDGTVFYQGVRDFGLRYPRNRVWTTMPVRLAHKNDCLLSVRAPVGELNLAGETTCIGRGLASVRSSADEQMSLFHLLKESPQIWAPYEAEGTVFGSIKKQQLQSLRLPAVRPDRRRILEHQLVALELCIAAALDENNGLAAIRDALLPELLSGKIRVKDAEKTVEEVL